MLSPQGEQNVTIKADAARQHLYTSEVYASGKHGKSGDFSKGQQKGDQEVSASVSNRGGTEEIIKQGHVKLFPTRSIPARCPPAWD